MSEILIQDPGSNEAQSPLIAGLTEGLNKISKILNLQTGTLTDEPLRNVPISESDKNRIYQAQDGKRLWLSSPAPTFKKNGSPITQEQAQFSIDYVGGSISFNELGRLGDSDKVTVSCTYIIATSKTISDLTNELSETSDVANKYKGSYANLSALQSSHATANVGDFAVVQDPGAVYIWSGSAWKNTQSIEDLSVYYKKTEVDNLLNKKEPTISAHGSSTSDDNFFYGGRKTWVDLYSKVRSATLTGLSTATNSAISATDTVLSAFGKLQAQVSGATSKAFLTGTGAPSTSTKGAVGQRYVNTSNGDWYTCTAAGSTYTWKQGQDKITSLKNPYSLTISFNGSSQAVYDGSVQKEVNITPYFIGAAESSHTHTANNITGLTANRALVSDTSGRPAVSSVTNVELGYLSGVTSNIQSQLNAMPSKAPVQSVNGKTGAVTITPSLIGAATTAQGQKADKALIQMGLVTNGTNLQDLTLGIWQTDGSHKITPWPDGLNDSAIIIRNNNQTIMADVFGTLATFDHYYNVWKFNSGNVVASGGLFPNGQKPDSVPNGYFTCNASNKPSPWPDGVNEDSTLVRIGRFVQLVDVFGTVKTWNIYSQAWR